MYELIKLNVVQSVSADRSNKHLKRKRWIITSSLVAYATQHGNMTNYTILPIPPLLSVSDVSIWFQIGKTSTYELIKLGIIKTSTLSGKVRAVTKRIIFANSLLDFIFGCGRRPQNCLIQDLKATLSLPEVVETFPVSRSYVKNNVLNGNFTIVKHRQKYGIKHPVELHTEPIYRLLSGVA